MGAGGATLNPNWFICVHTNYLNIRVRAHVHARTEQWQRRGCVHSEYIYIYKQNMFIYTYIDTLYVFKDVRTHKQIKTKRGSEGRVSLEPPSDAPSLPPRLRAGSVRARAKACARASASAGGGARSGSSPRGRRGPPTRGPPAPPPPDRTPAAAATITAGRRRRSRPPADVRPVSVPRRESRSHRGDMARRALLDSVESAGSERMQ